MHNRKDKNEFPVNQPLHNLADQTTSSTEDIKKEFPERTFVADNPICKWNEVEIRKVIKILRANSCAKNNCNYLLFDLIKYFRTGILPTGPSSIKSSINDVTLFNAYVNYSSLTIKSESPTKVSIGAHKRVRRDTSYGDFIPTGTTYREISGGIDLSQPVIDLEHFTAPNTKVEEINNSLMAEAAKNNPEISFGMIGLSDLLCNEEEINFDHVLFYFATKDNVFFIDCHKMNKGKGDPIFYNLKEAYPFSENSESALFLLEADSMFGNIVFYISMDPFKRKTLEEKNENHHFFRND